MSIKVTIGESETQKEKPFPKLMVSELGQIVLMERINDTKDHLLVGYLIKSNGFSIGESGYTVSWDRTSFTDFEGSITLQND